MNAKPHDKSTQHQRAAQALAVGESADKSLATPPVVASLLSDNKISLANIRQECIKLSHSAGKSVKEIILDAQKFTDWVATGKIPEDD
jgi:hypothetical protein